MKNKDFVILEMTKKELEELKEFNELIKYIEKKIPKEYYIRLIAGFIRNKTFFKDLKECKNVIDDYVENVINRDK